ncbi:hypothetical protein [Haladaptatus caseinilyticus]|uniref:hypothetical protein n=1 Tax=Haladaptatus caseinilyticus TaxID=2993314 RepID=UPI00224A5B07|nr:hypothetical protein [Haladaptatus caseinilyticus]
MTSSNDHTNDGTKLGQDENELDDPDMTFVTQGQYERESHHDLTTEIIFAIAVAEDVAPIEIKDPSLYECVDIAAIEDGFFGKKVAGHTLMANHLRESCLLVTRDSPNTICHARNASCTLTPIIRDDA